MAFINYINDLKRLGKCSFSISQAIEGTGKSRKAILSSIEHLTAKCEVSSPAKGFYVIIPPEYQILGCLPPEHFIPYLMIYWGCEYYVALLSAASYHGATHQAVQQLQVMIDHPKHSIICGKVKIQFLTKRELQETPIQTIATPKSMLYVSTPEGTAKDLIEYPHRSGGLNSIYTVLSELHESMDVGRLSELVKNNKRIEWKQRLGYLLEKIGADELSNVLKEDLAKMQRVDYILLAPGVSEEIERNKTWKIIINTSLESDL